MGGVGYLVSATPSVLRRADGASEVTVETYLHVREDALQLYGFADAAERALFVQLLGVSGIGPKVALAVVSSASPEELQRAIALSDSARFQAIPGIGKKTAERIVLELEGSIAEAVASPGAEAPARARRARCPRRARILARRGGAGAGRGRSRSCPPRSECAKRSGARHE